MKKRRCLCCKEYFPMDEMINPRNGWYKDFDHMAAHGLAKSRKQAVKKDKQSHAKKKKELKDNDKSFQRKKTQDICNKFIRLRDRGKVCISCDHTGTAGGYIGSGGIHAGHYRSVGAMPSLRYNSLNIHAQCAQCNNIKSGNAIEFRIGLIKKIGLDKVEWLEGPHEPKRYTIENLKTLQKWFKRKTKRMEIQQ